MEAEELLPGAIMALEEAQELLELAEQENDESEAQICQGNVDYFTRLVKYLKSQN